MGLVLTNTLTWDFALISSPLWLDWGVKTLSNTINNAKMPLWTLLHAVWLSNSPDTVKLWSTVCHFVSFKIQSSKSEDSDRKRLHIS